MEALDARVDWYLEFANSPKLILLVDKIPDSDDFVFEQRGNLYFAEKDGGVRFFAYSGPDRGFAGRHFPIKMNDGTTKKLIGPWSSRAGCMNDAGFTKCVDIAYTDDPQAFRRGYTMFGGHCTLDLARKAVEKFLPEVDLVWINGRGEEVYDPVLKDGRRKPYPPEHKGNAGNLWSRKERR